MDTDIFNRLRNLPDFQCGTPVDDHLIDEYESKLNVKFPEAYRVFLRMFGYVKWSGQKILGISENLRFDLISSHNRSALRNCFPPKYCIFLNADFAMKCLPRDAEGAVIPIDLFPTPGERLAFASFVKYVNYCVSMFNC